MKRLMLTLAMALAAKVKKAAKAATPATTNAVPAAAR